MGKLSYRAHAQMPVVAENSDEAPSSQLSYMDTFLTLCQQEKVPVPLEMKRGICDLYV
jgi:RNase P subunit RPR2